MPNDSLRSNTDRIRAACQELENALENFNRAPEAADSNTSNAPGAPSPQNSSRLEQIQTQLTDIRRQIDDLS